MTRLPPVLACVLLGCGPPATLTQIETDVFARSCAQTSCHKGSSSAGNLNLEGRTYAKLVNAMALEPGAVLVVPGKPDASWLMKKLSATPPLTIMPPGEALEPQRLEMVRSWIAAGAKDD